MAKIKRKEYARSDTEGAHKNQKKPKKNKCSRVTKKKPLQKYSPEKVRNAFNAVSEGQTLREAADNYGVPKSTLHWRLKHNCPHDVRKGPKTVLDQEEEKEIVNWILGCHERGFPVTKKRLLDCVQELILEDKRETPFKDGRPGKQWYKAFMSRNPTLSSRVAQNLTCTRAAVTEEQLRSWFSYVRERLDKKGLLEIDSKRVFNLDESAFKLIPNEDKVIAPKGARTVYRIIGANEKATLTVLFTASAAGELAPPMVLFELKTTPKRNTLQYIPRGWGVGNSDGGWMTGESFYSYIKNIFYKWLVENEFEFPVLLYLDNHSSHVNIKLLKFCEEKGIQIIALYPNSTHIIQPLDVAFFHPLKEAYKKAVVQYKSKNNLVDFKKCMIPTVLQIAIDSMDFTKSIVNGFRTSGLYPLDPNAVNYNILNKRRKESLQKSTGESSLSHSNGTRGADENIKLLNYFETNIISHDVLRAFLKDEHEGIWTGEPTSKDLFESWLKMRRLCVGSMGEEEKETACSNINFSNEILSTSYSSNISESSAVVENLTTNSQSCQEIIRSNIIDFTDQSHSKSTNIDNSGLFSDLAIDAVQRSCEGGYLDKLGNHETVSLIEVIPDDNTCSVGPLSLSEEEYLEPLEFFADEKMMHLEEESSIDHHILIEKERSLITEFNADEKILNSKHDGKIGLLVSETGGKEITTEFEELFISSTCEVIDPSIRDSVTDPLKDLCTISNSTNTLQKNDSIIENQCEKQFIGSENSTNMVNFKKVFKVPDPNIRRKKKTNSIEGTSAYFIDDMIENLEAKETAKLLKEREIQINKEKREKKKLIKAKETDINKSLQVTKNNLLKLKKELQTEIKAVKSIIKSESEKGNINTLNKKLENLTEKLENVERSITLHEMEALASKLKIKKEKL